jgi:probable O-glycosylation ligase (exosortase A-associated)
VLPPQPVCYYATLLKLPKYSDHRDIQHLVNKMALRDLAVFLIVFGTLPLILSRPYLGILLWSWLGYMNPHRLGWGMAYSFPFAQITAITLFFSMLTSKDYKRIPMTGLVVLWLTFIVWMCITTVFAMFPDEAYEQLIKILKIQLVIFLTIMLIDSKEKLNHLLWVIVVSIGYFGVKGGIFTLMTAGNFRVWGPPGSFITDNNALGLALVMTLPLMNYLRTVANNQWIRRGLLIAMLLVSVSIVGSYSRAAFLAGIAMTAFLLRKSKHKVPMALATLVLLPLLILFMPQAWHDRMFGMAETTEEGRYEESAQSRLDAWKTILNLAKDRPILGAGLNPWNPIMHQMYSESHQSTSSVAAHSIYFSVLAEHGWGGLAMFVSIFVIGWRTASQVIRQCQHYPELDWLNELMKAMQVSLIGYGVGGAFHQLPYFDLPWHIVSMIVIGRMIVQTHNTPSTKPVIQYSQPIMGIGIQQNPGSQINRG